jgi:hypothetical protein
MPDGHYYRKQAQLFARLAVTASDPTIAERYNFLALEQLAKAEEAEPTASDLSHAQESDGGSDMDRD